MQNPKNNFSIDNKRLYQKLSCAFYLIPNIENYLLRALEIINQELSLIASSAYYKPSKDTMFTVTSISDTDSAFSEKRLAKLTEHIIKENHALIENKKGISVDQNLDACIIPICYEHSHLGLLTLFYNKGFLKIDGFVLDLILDFVAAAFIGNYIITSRANPLFDWRQLDCKSEVSLKNLLEWRLEGIMNGFVDVKLSEQNLFQEISQETEKILLRTALKQTGNNKSKAARFLGLNRNTLMKKVKELKIQ